MASTNPLPVVPLVDPILGREFDNYVVEKMLGQGGMGTVYFARHKQLPSKGAAVKILKSEVLGDAQLAGRFLREAEALTEAEKKCAHVVKLYNYGKFDAGQYLLMEYLEGES